MFWCPLPRRINLNTNLGQAACKPPANQRRVWCVVCICKPRLDGPRCLLEHRKTRCGNPEYKDDIAFPRSTPSYALSPYHIQVHVYIQSLTILHLDQDELRLAKR